MKTKLLRFILQIVMAVLTLSACSDSHRATVIADITNGSDITLRAVTYSPEGVTTALLATRSGHCEWQVTVPSGDSDVVAPVFVELYTNDYRLLGVFSALPEEEIKLTVSPSGIEGFKIERSSGANDFDSALNEFLSSVKGKVTNDQIERFVRRHPSNVAAYSVLTTLYDAADNPGAAVDLLAVLRPEAKPGYYDNGFATMASVVADRPARLSAYSVLSFGDTIVNINPQQHTKTLIAFTADEAVHKDSVVHLLATVSRRRGNNLVVEHNLLADTITWHRSVRADSATWMSVWSGPGVGAPGVGVHGIARLPHYVVADSTGLILYAGASATAALRHF